MALSLPSLLVTENLYSSIVYSPGPNQEQDTMVLYRCIVQACPEDPAIQREQTKCWRKEVLLSVLVENELKHGENKQHIKMFVRETAAEPISP